MEALNIKLERVEARYKELEALLISEEVYTNPQLMAKLAKEQASLKQSYDAYQELKGLEADIKEAKLMLEDSDKEIVEMAEVELADANEKHEALIAHIEKLLIPKDPNDDRNALVEIRGAAGGDEGNIFAGDLFRMYGYYAENLGYKTEVMESSESEAGGYTLISFRVKGNGAYRHFKFESGSHRVQRVPKTETQGRVHTSTATVLVLPEIEAEDVEIDENDLTFETHRASGAGGQHINKTDSAVRIVHVPTGITVNCQDGRSQIQNRETALRIIRSRVFEEYERIRKEKEGEVRKSKVGSGSRSEKIRTYNYPQNRVTDHRIGLTINQLDRIIAGKLDAIVEALLAEEERQILLAEAEQDDQ